MSHMSDERGKQYYTHDFAYHLPSPFGTQDAKDIEDEDSLVSHQNIQAGHLVNGMLGVAIGRPCFGLYIL